MDTAKPIRFRFGPFEVDVTAEEIFADGEPVPLQSKPFQFLAMLLQHQGSPVTREQMSHVLWPDIYVQVNQGLNAAARKVRIALGDDFVDPKYFETMGSYGYRFIHPVEILAWSTSGQTNEERLVRLAVLPFGAEPGAEGLGTGFAGDLVSMLGRAHSRLKVIAPTSVQGYLGADIAPRAIGEQLNVRFLLMGQVRYVKDRLSVEAKLTEVPEEKVLWDGKSEVGNIAEALNQIACGSLASLQPDLLPCHAAAPLQAKMRTTLAREYFAAQQIWFRRTGSNLGLALAAHQRVCERDPQFAPAQAGTANAWLMLAAHDLAAPRPAYQAALAAAERALELSPEMPEALVAKAWAMLALEHDWAQATRMFERALHLNSSYAFGYAGYGHLLLSRGRVDEAVSAMEQGYLLDPLSGSMSADFAMACYYARRYDETIRAARQTLEIDSKNCTAMALLGGAYLAQRRFSDALQQFETGVEYANGESAVMEAHLAHAYAEAGRTAHAEPILHRLETRAGHAPKPAYQIALVRLGLGDVNGAVRWLERACQERFPRTLFLAVDPRLDILRGTKHFEEMCKQVREPDFRQMGRGRRREQNGAA
jgi:DNA-binding winged helix-turn-helix (wHTH) protein/tetratricopeptide (TPR) repeat protein